jgi:hypothetical protein
LKRKINLTKEKKMRTKLEKIIYYELGLKDEIENIKTFTKCQKEKIQIKRGTKLEKTYT